MKATRPCGGPSSWHSGKDFVCYPRRGLRCVSISERPAASASEHRRATSPAALACSATNLHRGGAHPVHVSRMASVQSSNLARGVGRSQRALDLDI